MTRVELWAGVESSYVRVGDRYVDQLELTGHAARVDDLDRLAELGCTAVRYPVLWERTLKTPGAEPDWSFADERLGRLRVLGIRPIVGLVHHGSGPRHTSLLERSFVRGLASFARMVAKRYPWVTDYTPVNEPLTTARFSGLYGHWYPHGRTDAAFVRALLIECQAIRSAMRAIREVVPEARLIQTEDLGTVFSTRRLAYQAEFENHRRFASLDLLFGRIGQDHSLRDWLLGAGLEPHELDDFATHPSPPDVVGLNHYVTSDRWLDERVDDFPPHVRGGNGRETYADVEAVRSRRAGISGHRALLDDLWARYRRPLAITEVHLGCAPEEQIRWLAEAWAAAESARAGGADVRAVTVWSIFGACDWDSLLTNARGHYEPGAFDVRGGAVRKTALATVARELATTGASAHPLADDPGWWRRNDRLIYSPPSTPSAVAPASPAPVRRISARPVLVTGAAGTLGRAIARVCGHRALHVVPLARQELDICDPSAVEAALERHRPWAVVNASGYVRVDDAESDRRRCFEINVAGALVLADRCAARGIRHALFSSDLVFDGRKGCPYDEDDAVSPLNVYGASKATAERLIRGRNADAILARTSAFFGPWDEANFIHHALTELRSGRAFRAASDQVVSPTYVPDLANAILTLLVDGAAGLWHVATPGALSWYALARAAAQRAGVSTDRLIACSSAELELPARRPVFSVLTSKQGVLLRPLDEALTLFCEEQATKTLAQAG